MLTKSKVGLLFGAAIVGAVGVGFWDHMVQATVQKLADQNIANQKQDPAVDPHILGIHGKWSDPRIDEDGPRSAKDLAEIAKADEIARPIFETPGGAYTAQDIAMNGTRPPFERFNRFAFNPKMKAFPAQPLDPITLTKTGGALDWYVGGKLYHFASVASLEEFVIRAKKDPKSVPPPEMFVVPGKPVD